MKKIKKMIFPLCAFILAIVGIISVSASSYTTLLELGPGHRFTGSTRYYTAGKPQIAVNVNYFVKSADDNRDYSRMIYQLQTSDGRVMRSTEVALSYAIMGETVTLLNNWTNVAAGDYKWFFNTSIDGVNYNGFLIDPMILETA